MKYHFHADRQGAAGGLDSTDLVLVRGTPRYLDDGTERDMRIRISLNGDAERALWVCHEGGPPDLGLHQVFTRWDAKLGPDTVSRIASALSELKSFPVHPDDFGSDSIRIIRFREGDQEHQVCMVDPPDQFGEPLVTSEESERFWRAWDLIEAAVPGNESRAEQRHATDG